MDKTIFPIDFLFPIENKTSYDVAQDTEKDPSPRGAGSGPAPPQLLY